MERPDNSQIPYHIRKPASDTASSIMETISPRGPASFGTLSNEKWNLGHELITAAISDLIDQLEIKHASLKIEIAAKVGAYREIKATEDDLAKIATAYEQDAANQSINMQGSSDKELRAYAQGRGLTSESIAKRLRALLPAAPSAPSA